MFCQAGQASPSRRTNNTQHAIPLAKRRQVSFLKKHTAHIPFHCRIRLQKLQSGGTRRRKGPQRGKKIQIRPVRSLRLRQARRSKKVCSLSLPYDDAQKPCRVAFPALRPAEAAPKRCFHQKNTCILLDMHEIPRYSIFHDGGDLNG